MKKCKKVGHLELVLATFSLKKEIKKQAGKKGGKKGGKKEDGGGSYATEHS